MNFFVRYNVNFSNIDFDDSQLSLDHEEIAQHNQNVYSVNYYSLSSDLEQQIRSKLPSILLEIIYKIRIGMFFSSLPPHVDKGGHCSLNYYLITDGGKTTFWSVKSESDSTQKNRVFDSKYIFDHNELVEECSFTAEDHSCYLLNTGKIHDVKIKEPTGLRKILQFTFKNSLDYEQIQNKLSDLKFFNTDSKIHLKELSK